MPTRRPRQTIAVRAFAFLFAASVLAVTATASSTVAGAKRASIDINEFMAGLACVESSGRYEALNERSGAYGKYQIMPRNWRAWAARYLGNRWAPPTPRNQEFVARQRIAALYELRGDWRRVAYWWLTGDGEADQRRWTTHASRYVDKVMGVVALAADPRPSIAATVRAQCFPGEFREPRIRTEPLPRVRVTGGRVYVRLEPGAEHRIVTVVRRGQKLAVLGSANDARGKRWLKVGLPEGRIGWMAAWFGDRLPSRP